MLIKQTDKGIGFRIGDTIYLNKYLNEYPNLKKAVLKHELAHTDKFTLKDLKLDLTGSNLEHIKSDYYKFLFRHPKCLMMFLPVLRIDKEIVFDPIMTTLWLIFIGIMIFLGVIL